MAGLGGAAYSVWVEFGLRNRMAQGMRDVQAQLRGVQAKADAAAKATADRIKVIQNHVGRYGTIWGNPKSFEEAKRNLDTISRQKTRLLNAMSVQESASRRAAMQDQLAALRMTERDVREKARGLKYTEDSAKTQERAAQAQERSQERSRINEQRTRYRLISAEQRERRDADRAHQKRIQQYRNLSSNAFKTSEYSAIGAAGIFGGLFESGKAAAQQQQLAATTAMVLGLTGPAFASATEQLMKNQMDISMKVGMLSSADIAAIQTQLAMHTPGLGLKGLTNLTPFVAQYADVMKMTLGEAPEESAKTAAMAANIFGARDPRKMREFLNRFFVMEQSTGVSQDTAVKALTQYGAMGKSLGFSDQDMLDLYGQAFRLGAGGGKAGARLAAVMRGLATIPTSVVKTYFESQLGLIGNDGIPTVLKQNGQIKLDSFLQGLHKTYQRLLSRDGAARGKAEFITGLNAAYGAAASNVLFPMIQSGSLKQFEEQKKRESQFYSIEQAQATFFHMPINQYQRFLTNVKTFVIEFGTYVLPLFNQFFETFANRMQHWTEWMQKNPKAMKNLVDGLVNLGELLIAIAGASAVVGAVSRVIEAFLNLRDAIGLLKLAAAEGRLAFLGPLGLVAAVALTAWYFRDPLIKALEGFLHWLQGLPVIGKFFGTNQKPMNDLEKKTGWNKTAITALQHAKTIQALPAKVGSPNDMQEAWDAFKGWWDWMHSDSIPNAPSSMTDTTHVTNISIDGKRVATAVTKQRNRAMSGALNSTTYGQGTRHISRYQTRSNLNSPNTR